jgi:integrase/recombinase XerD
MSDENEVPEVGEVSETLHEYLYEKRGIPTSTFKNHRSVVGRFEGWLAGRDTELLGAEPRDVKNWLIELHQDGYAGSTVRQYHQTLRAFYSEFTDNEDDDEASMLPTPLDENPAKFDLGDYLEHSTSPKKQQYADNNEGVVYLEPSEVRELRAHVPDPKIRNELLVKVLVQTGIRCGELSDVEIRHLDREEEHIQVTEEASKTDTERKVPFDNLEPELSLWLDEGYRNHLCTSDSPYLFISRQSEQLSPSRISTIIREAAENAGMTETYAETVDGKERRRVSAHGLRATFIVRCLEAGLPTPKVMELSGHENLETVEKYANILSDDAIDAYQAADIEFGAN